MHPVAMAGHDRFGLAREIVVERARRYVGSGGDILDEDVVQAALDSEADSRPAQGISHLALLALPQPDARFVFVHVRLDHKSARHASLLVAHL